MANMKTKYILVEFPESQKWLDHPDCYLCGNKLSCAVFIPENIYNNSKPKTYPISNNKYEIWAIDKDGIIIAEFSSFKQADNFKKDYFQILYKNTRTSPVHVYKQK